MKDYSWNPYKDNRRNSDEYKNSNWNFDPRDENYYLGRINKPGNNDTDMRYYTDGITDRYYLHNEMEKRNGMAANDFQIREPYKNNAFEGHRKKKYSFEGPYRGKGPKDYNRSPERITEDASERLADDTLVDASDIEIDVAENEITLSGTVHSRFEKHRAENLIENVSGIKHIQNNLRVAKKR